MNRHIPTMIDGTLEVDHDRGVIYFHSNRGLTTLRICHLPKPIPKRSGQWLEMLDITHMHGCNWGNDDYAKGQS